MKHGDSDRQDSRSAGISRRAFLKKSGSAAAVLAVGGKAAELLASGSRQGRTEAYDTIVRGGLVYDGVLPSPRKADIGVRGDRILAVGDLSEQTAARHIDASGKMVTPGFVDIHTHCDLTFKRSGWKRHLAAFMPSWKGNYNYLYQGVTTVVTGNCGYGYTDTAKWLDQVDSLSFGTNVAHLAPHGMLRIELFGETQGAHLTGGQLDRFAGRVAEEMQKGALGLSTGLEYAPGLLTPPEEIVRLLKTVRRHGGVYTTHRRDETGRIHADGRAGTLRSTVEALEAARDAEVPLEISHLKIASPRSGLQPAQLLDLIEQARESGLDVTADQYPYTAGSTYITILLPHTFKTSLGIKEEFKTASGRKAVAAAIREVYRYLGPEKILISNYPGNEDLEGKTIQAISDMRGMPVDVCFTDMVCDDPPPVGIFFTMDVKDVKAIMQPEFMITASDGWTVPKDMTKPHPRCYGAFARKIGHFVLQEKTVELSAAIRSMTSLPAEKFKIRDRGRLAAGYHADIAVLDLAAVGDHATYLDPHQYASGVDYLLVNGVVSIEKGLATGERGGKALRKA